MNTYTLTAVFAGIVVLLAAWLPGYLRERPLSLPMVLLVIGAVTFTVIPGLGTADPRPRQWCGCMIEAATNWESRSS